MSELNGLELQRQLAILGDTPILLMSGVCGVFEVIRAFRAGALDFLIKPIDADQLLEAVQKSLAISFQRQESWQRQTSSAERIASLTEREREIARRVVRGQTNLDSQRNGNCLANCEVISAEGNEKDWCRNNRRFDSNCGCRKFITGQHMGMPTLIFYG